MMNRILSLSAIVFILFGTSCKKEDPNVVHVAAPPHPPTSSLVTGIPLNGGNISGRWTLTYLQSWNEINDSLTYYDTASYSPGMITVNFFTNGTLELIDGDTGIYPYWCSGNQLYVMDVPDTIVFNYGTTGNKMRWNETEDYWIGPDHHQAEYDDVFERY
jgi:hypothetical protein